MSEHDFEAVRGLPGQLPPGETIVWQGAPTWRRLAEQAFHIRLVGAYFALMLVWRAGGAIAAGTAPDKALLAALSVAPLALLALGMIAGLAWLTARTTVYTITTKRVVMRFGVALPKAINLPFGVIESAALKPLAGGSGDLALTLKAPNKVAFLHLWPHARPWKVAAPQPTFRAIPDAQAVAVLLANAMKSVVPIEVVRPAAAARGPSAAVGAGRPEAAAA